MRIAFAGNPNSGKTTMFNALTGKKAKVGNWGGVTVGRAEAKLKNELTDGREAIAVDLPGAYSMSPFTPEETITSKYVHDANPDAIVNIVDATNLRRSLFFTTQLLELGVPVVVALNKSDINKKEDTRIDVQKLQGELWCPVVPTVSTAKENNGLGQVLQEVFTQEGKGQKAPYLQADIDLTDKQAVDKEDRRRYEFVDTIVDSVEKRAVKVAAHTRQDTLDAVLTNKFAGVAILRLYELPDYPG